MFIGCVNSVDKGDLTETQGPGPTFVNTLQLIFYFCLNCQDIFSYVTKQYAIFFTNTLQLIFYFCLNCQDIFSYVFLNFERP